MSVVMQQLRLRCFGQTERMETEKLVSKYRILVIDSAAGGRRPRKTWDQVVQSNLQTLQLEKRSLRTLMDAIKMPQSYPCYHGTDAKRKRRTL